MTVATPTSRGFRNPAGDTAKYFGNLEAKGRYLRARAELPERLERLARELGLLDPPQPIGVGLGPPWEITQ